MRIKMTKMYKFSDKIVFDALVNGRIQVSISVKPDGSYIDSTFNEGTLSQKSLHTSALKILKGLGELK